MSQPLKDLNDEQLIEAYRAGQGRAFRHLIQRYQRPLFNHLVRLLGSKDDAEDAFQETFLRVYRALSRFETGRRFKPWLYTIAGNLVKNIYRSRVVRKKLSLDRELSDDNGADLGSILASVDPTPFDEVAREERAKILREAVQELPPKGRQALVLYYFEGHSYEDIASIAEIPLGTVKSRIHNATAQLIRSLGILKEGPGS